MESKRKILSQVAGVGVILSAAGCAGLFWLIDYNKSDLITKLVLMGAMVLGGILLVAGCAKGLGAVGAQKAEVGLGENSRSIFPSWLPLALGQGFSVLMVRMAIDKYQELTLFSQGALPSIRLNKVLMMLYDIFGPWGPVVAILLLAAIPVLMLLHTLAVKLGLLAPAKPDLESPGQ